MASSPPLPSAAPFELGNPPWQRWFLILTAALSSTILLKLGQIQYLELLYALQIGLLLRAFAREQYRTTILPQMLLLGGLYSVFIVVGLLFAVLDSSQDFYIPPGVSALHLPITIAVLRAAELFASVAIMLYLTHILARSQAKLRLALRVFFWVGVASAAWSLLTLPLQMLGLGSWGTYSYVYRWRGFYNEGGPYGLYLMSVFLVAFALLALGWEHRTRTRAALVLLAVAFLGSQSKAAFVAIVALFLVNALLLQSGTRRLVTLAALAGSLLVINQFVDLQTALRLYRQGAGAYERLSRRHTGDINFVQGRVAGTFIVPRMIAQHPILGVGWGNYGLVRNAPEYRGAAAWADFADEPSLGLFGQAAELGLPLSALLLLCLFLPYLSLRRMRAPGFVLNLALLQPTVHLFGAQLNLTYPWVVTAFALGAGYALRRSTASPSTPPVH